MVIFNIPHAVQAEEVAGCVRGEYFGPSNNIVFVSGAFGCINCIKCLACPSCICPATETLAEQLAGKMGNRERKEQKAAK